MERAPRPGSTTPTDPQSVRDLIQFDPHGTGYVPIFDPATKKTNMQELTPYELEMLTENQFEVRAELKRRREGEGFRPSEKKLNPLTGKPERQDYESPFEDEVPVQYDRADGTVRRGTEWNLEDSEGAVMKWGDQSMDQEYIVTTSHEDGTPANRYYIFGSRVYDLTAAEAAGAPADFRDFPTSIPLHRTVRGDDGSALPQRKIGKDILQGRIGEEWIDSEGRTIFPGHRGNDPHNRIIISKVETRGEVSPSPLPLADRPNRGADPFDAVDALIPLATRTAPRPHGERRSDQENPWAVRRRKAGRATMHFVGLGGLIPEGTPPELAGVYPTTDTHEGRLVGHNLGHEEWERMDAREQRRIALERVNVMIDALADVSSPAIETEIKVFQPRLPGRPNVARLAGLRRRAVDPAQVAKGQVNHDRKTDRSQLVDVTTGWVLNFTMEGDQIYIKTTSPNRNRDADLIIEKPAKKGQKARSWGGGMEVRIPGQQPGSRTDRPAVVGVGSRMGSLGQYGEDAIDRWTRSDKPEGDNTDVEVTKLIALANALYALGQETVPAGSPNPMEGLIPPHLRPDFFGR